MNRQPEFHLRRYVPATGPGQKLSRHPNLEGAKLSALQYVSDGSTITWTDESRGGTWYGAVNREKPKFCIVRTT